MIPRLEFCLYHLLTLWLVPLNHLSVTLDAYPKSVTTNYCLPDHCQLIISPLYSVSYPLAFSRTSISYLFLSFYRQCLCLSSFSLVKQLLIYLTLKRGGQSSLVTSILKPMANFFSRLSQTTFPFSSYPHWLLLLNLICWLILFYQMSSHWSA